MAKVPNVGATKIVSPTVEYQYCSSEDECFNMPALADREMPKSGFDYCEKWWANRQETFNHRTILLRTNLLTENLEFKEGYKYRVAIQNWVDKYDENFNPYHANCAKYYDRSVIIYEYPLEQDGTTNGGITHVTDPEILKYLEPNCFELWHVSGHQRPYICMEKFGNKPYRFGYLNPANVRVSYLFLTLTEIENRIDLWDPSYLRLIDNEHRSFAHTIVDYLKEEIGGDECTVASDCGEDYCVDDRYLHHYICGHGYCNDYNVDCSDVGRRCSDNRCQDLGPI